MPNEKVDYNAIHVAIHVGALRWRDKFKKKDVITADDIAELGRWLKTNPLHSVALGYLLTAELRDQVIKLRAAKEGLYVCRR